MYPHNWLNLAQLASNQLRSVKVSTVVPLLSCVGSQDALSFAAPATNGARVRTPKRSRRRWTSFSAVATTKYAGANEQLFGNMDWKTKGVLMETKLFSVPPELGLKHIGDHSPESIRKFCQMSLDALKTDQVEMWYLHGPDHRNSFEDSLRAVNELYKEGKFKRLGISNYTAWEVAEIVGICERHGWVKPTAYEGLYNAIHRAAEPELFPCLRKFGIAFYEYNPRHWRRLLHWALHRRRQWSGPWVSLRQQPCSWHGKSHASICSSLISSVFQMYRKRYWNDNYFEALAEIKQVGEKHGLTLPEIALRWINHHSLMKREHGDSILIGASRKSHLEQNLVDLEKGPLPEEVVKVPDDMWDMKLEDVCSSYAFQITYKGDVSSVEKSNSEDNHNHSNDEADDQHPAHVPVMALVAATVCARHDLGHLRRGKNIGCADQLIPRRHPKLALDDGRRQRDGRHGKKGAGAAEVRTEIPGLVGYDSIRAAVRVVDLHRCDEPSKRQLGRLHVVEEILRYDIKDE
ncbi:unnamed protein product [Mycena citricolor]|uniref:NADP-dependent oxidoreductase domain-containing protein n=1 Tax=Mycena citricolor TaxID=2018698 RepID=A0AAD2GQ95_9AGAR|nr:unnamed protein product [Mycena citricolor]